jgi:1,4-dihydroxy-2-naphthoate octaprenyltransferase
LRCGAQALTHHPAPEQTEWDRLDAVAKWLIATRAAVLIMTFISAAIAGIFAFRNGEFQLVTWLLLVVWPGLAHATNNLLNDLTDYRNEAWTRTTTSARSTARSRSSKACGRSANC